MAINESLYHGVPSTLESGLAQFEELKEEFRGQIGYEGRFLVLKFQMDGKYAGCYTNWVYETEPKSKYLKIHKIPIGKPYSALPLAPFTPSELQIKLLNRDAIKKHAGRNVTVRGTEYRVGQMSYGQWFLIPASHKGGENVPFPSDTLWLIPVKDHPHYFEVN